MKKVEEIKVTNVEELKDAINSGYYESVPYLKINYLKEGTTIDENETIKWNRDEVERLNAETKQKLEENRAERVAMNEKETNDIITAYSNYSGFSKEAVNVVYSYAHQESHAYGIQEILGTLEEVLDVMIKIKNMENQ